MALAYEAANKPPAVLQNPASTESGAVTTPTPHSSVVNIPTVIIGVTASVTKSKSFHGNIEIKASAAKLRLVHVAEEIIAVLAADPNADLKITLEIQATFPTGAQDNIKRAVSENSKALGFRNADWE